MIYLHYISSPRIIQFSTFPVWILTLGFGFGLDRHLHSGLPINKDVKEICGKGATQEISGALQETEAGVQENVRHKCQSVSAGEGRGWDEKKQGINSC